METKCEAVKPGDLITAEFINLCVLDRLQDIETRLAEVEKKLKDLGQAVTTDFREVPNVQGSTLREAQVLLGSNDLKPGKIYDGAGDLVTDLTPLLVSGDKVTSQSPSPGTKVAVGSKVDLSFKSSAIPSKAPVIYDFDPRKANPLRPVKILGDNFDSRASVTIGGKSVTVVFLSDKQLGVLVPSAADLGLTQTSAVKVVVTNPDKAHYSKNLTVTVERDVQPPNIGKIVAGGKEIFIDKGDPASRANWAIDPGDIFTINGQNFAIDPEDNQVTVIVGSQEFTLPVVAVSQDGASIQVQVPEALSTAAKTGKDKSVSIKVSKQSTVDLASSFVATASDIPLASH
jgi:hypothetical protein